MRKHPVKLEEALLWQEYTRKVTLTSDRYVWIKEVCDTAIEHLKAVRDTFPNYTLHDETHVVNVLTAMEGILGDQIDKLSVGELELLILAAALHDIGMVYSKEEKERTINNERKRTAFLRENCPELLGCPYEEWPEETQQWFLRKLHPFRLPEILKRTEWRDIFNRRPGEVVTEKSILAVCQAHGESPDDIRRNTNLKYLRARDTDPLFCALLLRLADLLDFDDTRAPKVLYSYAAYNKKSIEEWKKHMNSLGFTYHVAPSTRELPYMAECTSPEIEHAIRDFLDWIDDELDNCSKLQKSCEKDWQRNFPFPCAVSREEITSEGYVSGEFRLTMDQSQILKLLTGEHLYDSNTVFIRELLQNAVDATLLREKMDDTFQIDEGRIDLWEWNDRDGNIWFRIDDRGTGMTLGMLQRYFLKVGCSYYTSKEMIRDLRECGKQEEYRGISRFGIGFLSCFLCGEYAQVSTLYFDEEKNRQESATSYHKGVSFGLRMEVTGLNGYYTLKYEAENHIGGEPLPSHPMAEEDVEYRSEAGTSIVVRLDPGKLGFVNLRDKAEAFICGTRMPIYFNGKRIGRTYAEIMSAARAQPEETVNELSPEDKKRFDETFPEIQGQYPTIVTKTIPLDTEKYRILPDISGIVVKHDICFEKPPRWTVKDQTYELYVRVISNGGDPSIFLQATNAKSGNHRFFGAWSGLEVRYGMEEAEALKTEFMKLQAGPTMPEQLGDAWNPFADNEDIYNVWLAYVDGEQEHKDLRISLKENNVITLNSLIQNDLCEKVACAYHGMLAGNLCESNGGIKQNSSTIFFLENKWRPTVDVGRTRIFNIPLEVLLEIFGILYHPEVDVKVDDIEKLDCENTLLSEWRRMRHSELDDWLWETHQGRVDRIIKALGTARDEKRGRRNQEYITISEWIDVGAYILYKYLMAYFQDNYDMTIDYVKGQVITFAQKNESEEDDTYDLFPPMMFCRAADEQSRKYLCSEDSYLRSGITSDHPFAEWLLQNAVRLDNYFKRQFQQIVYSLCNEHAEYIIEKVNGFREQLIALHDHHNIDVTVLEPLTMDDFWSVED